VVSESVATRFPLGTLAVNLSGAADAPRIAHGADTGRFGWASRG
jgi:hypothetical protein